MMVIRLLFNPLLMLVAMIVLLCWLLCILEDWKKEHKTKLHVRLKFDEFVRMYAIAPYKYSCTKKRVVYDNSRICFSFIDYIRYQYWLKQQAKYEVNGKNMVLKKAYLEKVQKDIDAYREAAKKEVEEMGEKLRG